MDRIKKKTRRKFLVWRSELPAGAMIKGLRKVYNEDRKKIKTLEACIAELRAKLE